VIDEVFKIATNDTKGEDEVKRVSRKLSLSEFESVVDFRSRNASSTFMKALKYSRLQKLIVNKDFQI